MPYVDVVTESAQRLKLLGDRGRIVLLDSLTLLDLIAELEDATQIEIPNSEIRADVFESVESVAALLDRLAART